MINTIGTGSTYVGDLETVTRQAAGASPPPPVDPTLTYGVFDGVDDFVEVAADGTGTFDLQAYSIAVWVKPLVNENYHLLWSYDYTSHAAPYYAQALQIRTGGHIHSFIGASGGHNIDYTAGVGIYGVWNHIVLTAENGSQKLYLNGANVATKTHSTPWNYWAQEVWIGKSNFATSASMHVADSRFYNRVLTPAEVTAAYAYSPPSSGLILHYDYGQGYGTELTDQSASGIDGTANDITESTFWNPYTPVIFSDFADTYSVRITNTAELQALTDNLSISVRARANAAIDSFDAFLSRWDSGNGRQAFIFGFDNVGKIVFRTNATGVATTKTCISDAAAPDVTGTHTYGVTKLGTVCKLYIDGVEIASSGAVDATIYAAGIADLIFGATLSNDVRSNLTNMGIADVRIYKGDSAAVLSASDMLAIHEGTFSLPAGQNEIGNWPFNEGSGTVVGDISSYGNDGAVDALVWT